MKLYLYIFFSLSLLGAALSSPLDEDFRRTYQTANDDYVDTQHFQPNANTQGYTAEDVNQPVAQDWEGKSCKILFRMLINHNVCTLKLPRMFSACVCSRG